MIRVSACECTCIEILIVLAWHEQEVAGQPEGSGLLIGLRPLQIPAWRRLLFLFIHVGNDESSQYVCSSWSATHNHSDGFHEMISCNRGHLNRHRMACVNVYRLCALPPNRKGNRKFNYISALLFLLKRTAQVIMFLSGTRRHLNRSCGCIQVVRFAAQLKRNRKTILP